MNRLTLLRHAKSSWKKQGLLDIQRPLNARGLLDAPLMGRVCEQHLPAPDLVLLSPALRTRETVRLFLEAWGLPDTKLLALDQYYLADQEEWLKAIRSWADKVDHLILCGHQPGLGNLASWICQDFDHEMPTTTVASFLIGDELIRDSGIPDFIGCPRDYK